MQNLVFVFPIYRCLYGSKSFISDFVDLINISSCLRRQEVVLGPKLTKFGNKKSRDAEEVNLVIVKGQTRASVRACVCQPFRVQRRRKAGLLLVTIQRQKRRGEGCFG